jgi:hypothetical protein
MYIMALIGKIAQRGILLKIAFRAVKNVILLKIIYPMRTLCSGLKILQKT